MKKKETPKFTVLPAMQNKEDSLQFQTEMGISHSSFSDEYTIFNCIKQGNTQLLQNLLDQYFSHEMVMGPMSRNSLRQVQYWAVATISVAVHYAILGGLDETDAFNTSDRVILLIDACTNSGEIFDIIIKEAVKLTRSVQQSQETKASSSPVRNCLHFIHLNLDKKITLKDLSTVSGLSENYISHLFRLETGLSPMDYIHMKKIEESKLLLQKGIPYTEISYRLGFCSESHFISIFRRFTGITPGVWTSTQP